MNNTRCPFCLIIAGHAPAERVRQWSDAVAFVPLEPCCAAPDAVHWLVVPRRHATDAAADPESAGMAMRRAAELARERGVRAFNVITSAGAAATQTIEHTHLHLVERRPGDQRELPWGGQRALEGRWERASWTP